MRTLGLVLSFALLLADPASAQTQRPEKKAKPQAAKNACEEQKRLYRQSEACFARYRDQNHKLRPEAFKHCKEMPQPQC